MSLNLVDFPNAEWETNGMWGEGKTAYLFIFVFSLVMPGEYFSDSINFIE